MALNTTMTVGPGTETMEAKVTVEESESKKGKINVFLTFNPKILEYVPCSADPPYDNFDEVGGIISWYLKDCGDFKVTLALRTGQSLGTTVTGFAVDADGASKDMDKDWK